MFEVANQGSIANVSIRLAGHRAPSTEHCWNLPLDFSKARDESAVLLASRAHLKSCISVAENAKDFWLGW